MKGTTAMCPLLLLISSLGLQTIYGYEEYNPASSFMISPAKQIHEKRSSNLRGSAAADHFSGSLLEGLTKNSFSMKEGLISIDLAQDLFTHIPEKIDVTFFDDEDPTEFFEYSSSATPNEIFWSGHDEEERSSINILIVNEDTGEQTVTGSATIRNKVYNFVTDTVRGVIKVRESDVAKLPIEDQLDQYKIDHRKLHSQNLEGQTMTAQDLRYGDDDGSTIDIMCLWTPQALCAENGQQPGCDVNNVNYNNVMKNKCNLAIRETNVAYEQSGVLTLLNLVHSGIIDADYTEEENMCDILPLFQDSEDIVHSRVRQLRALKKADLVHMIVNEDQLQCGCGTVYNGYADQAYSVSNRECTTGYFSFGHEIGHNLGCDHNRQPGAPGSAYGYRSKNDDFRTIMSYNCLDSDGCPRIQKFSTQDETVTHHGVPVGDQYHDNVSQINNARFTVANFYKSNSQEYIVPTPIQASPETTAIPNEKIPVQASPETTATPNEEIPIQASPETTSTPNEKIPIQAFPETTATPNEKSCGWNQVNMRIKIQTTARPGSLSWSVKNLRYSKLVFEDSHIGGYEIISDHCIYAGNCYSFEIESLDGLTSYSVAIDGKKVVNGSSTISARSHTFSIDATRKKFWMGMRKKQSCNWLNSRSDIASICGRRTVRFGCPVTCNSMCQI